ncbi:hypothetical protein KIW84_056617 [Lathyrus oleraceus]|uniref:Major facilitator superfamily (MFS) profile domain-containing protein n=1 Tax=Pisum sativum TaxID=3888 RepID=A0A9D4X0Z4_PEA|nr:hypothetical protein KIW84_056617 [Pisum sativum]
MGGLLFGYDLGITGGVTSMEPFLVKFFPSVYKQMKDESEHESQYCKFNNELLTLFTSSLYLAALIASLFASTTTRMLGRKASMFAGGLFFLVGALLNGVAVNIEMLIIGHILLGFGVGYCNQSVPMYLSEMAPAKIRGALNMGFQMMITIGILGANIINYFTSNIESGWRISLGIGVVPAILLCIGSFFLGDTPNSMIERGQKEGAKKMLQKICGIDNVDEEFQDLIDAIITGGVNVVATFVSIFTMDKFGRKILFLEGGVQMFICQIVVGSMIAIKFGVSGEGSFTHIEVNLLLFSICVYVAAYAWSWGPLGWLVPNEICSLEVRSAGQATNVVVNMLFTFIIAQVFFYYALSLEVWIFLLLY